MKIRALFVVMLVAVTVGAAPLGTEFTYQGVLSDGGAAAAGAFDFRFILYDADAGGSQVGTIVYVEDLVVADGRLTTQLDFGDVFDGTALWLEVGVRDGGATGTYSVLSPRQEVTATPFAQHAQTAETAATAGHAATADSATSAGYATTAGDADTLNGQPDSFYLTWSNFLDIPPDLANGDDDTLVSLACSQGEITRWNGAAWTCSADDDTPYLRTFVVGPVGTPLENGLALGAAMGDIPVPTNQEGAVLLRLEAGVYDLGDQFEAPFPWMVIEGAGQEHTRITSAYCSVGVYQGTLLIPPTSEHVVLRHLTVENTCADPASFSIAVSNQADWLSVDHVTLTAKGAALNGYAMFNSGGSPSLIDTILHAENATGDNYGLNNRGVGASLTNVTVEAIGGTSAHGIDNDGHTFTFRQGDILASWASDDCTGIFNHTDADNLFVSDSKISATFGTAPVKRGVQINGADVKLNDVAVSGGVGVGLSNWSDFFATVQLRNVFVSASEFGVWVRDYEGNGCMVLIDGGRFDAVTDAVMNSLDTCDVRIGGANLINGVNGSALCAGVYDWAHNFYPDTCPAP